MLVPVILSGGSGTRLWPLSRRHFPKQFLPLTGNHSLLQQTLLRLGDLPAQSPVVIANDDHRFLAAEQLRALGREDARIFLEPTGRNTAPAATVAALAAAEAGQADALLLVMPADHVVQDEVAFRHAVNRGIPAAKAGWLVTFGVVPDQAHTGYGYIRTGQAHADGSLEVERFVEKPDEATARGFLDEGGYLWNAGIFLFRADAWLEEIGKFQPQVLEAMRASLARARHDLDFVRLDEAAFAQSPDISIDYAVMERTDRARVVPLDAGWSDIGSWDALKAVGDPDEQGNVVQGDALLEDTRNTLVHAHGRLVGTLGVEDLVIVETADAVLVAHRSHAQDVRRLVDRLDAAGRSEHLEHRCVPRPWGTYETIDVGERFQVKRITVKPGAALSLQMHHHRAEHWVVVRGTARVTRGEDSFLVSENESTYIPIGVRHRLENPGKLPLELIEVQSGAYLGEDDIIRF
ncbi:MAG: mannose-1-phosphate guanylyltransferase/mannose-6-phosphate isomerase [Gammaproteobacteria bacterium]|nr:MAG: mannose-1-phosphate guanylyltransferase/mannose-6-phosphate isomerase [Gammaproteobacteria bacterium]